jgi:hypothetical protein
MPNSPVISNRSSFSLEEIYRFVKRVHKQQRSLKESLYSKEEIKAIKARRLIDSSREPLDYRKIIKQARDRLVNQPVETKKPLPASVNNSVKELIKAIEG